MPNLGSVKVLGKRVAEDCILNSQALSFFGNEFSLKGLAWLRVSIEQTQSKIGQVLQEMETNALETFKNRKGGKTGGGLPRGLQAEISVAINSFAMVFAASLCLHACLFSDNFCVLTVQVACQHNGGAELHICRAKP